MTMSSQKRLILWRVAVLASVLLAALFVAACNTERTTTSTATAIGSTCSAPNPSVIPDAWRPEGKGVMISIDGDDDLECLIIYRYNITGDSSGPLGGVIFDPQTGADRLSNLATYRLLPWLNSSYTITGTVPGSQPGYLGILGEKSAEVRLYDGNGDGKADELGIVGADLAGTRTYLSLYRWQGASEGYRLLGYVHGNARVETVSPPMLNPDTKIYSGVAKALRAVDRLYDRSGLAMVYQYDRSDDGSRFVYRSNWIEFADGRPANTCLYPEGQVLSFYNNLNRPVFELRLFTEDDRSRSATVCAGSWEVTATQFRRYWTLVELEKQPAASVGACDAWVVKRELIEPGRISCNP